MSTASPSAPPAGAPRAPATSSRLWGPLLIGLGVLLLARQLLPIDLSDLVVGALLVVGGLFFLGAYGRDPANWVLLIPGIALCVLGLGRAIGSGAPRLGQAIGGGVLFGRPGPAGPPGAPGAPASTPAIAPAREFGWP